MNLDNIRFTVLGDELNELHHALRMLPQDTFEFKDLKNNQLEALFPNEVCQVSPSLGVIAKAQIPEGASNITEKFGHTSFQYMSYDYSISSREKI
jgi:hypothetical protein